ncbi:MAG: hypothetical protein Q9184_008057, partial [Pyrenodesmia sp. 2 TL-2023]
RITHNAEDSNFNYIQGHQDLFIEEKRQLADMDVEIQEYAAEYTYTATRRRTLSGYELCPLAQKHLKEMVEREADRTTYEVDLILHNNPNIDSAALAPYVAQRAGVDINELEILPSRIRLTVHQNKLDNLAALNSINRIEEVRPKSVYNDHARGILGADALFTSTDTGFDQGVADDQSSVKVHPAFAGRVDRLVSLWVTCGSGTYIDPVQGNKQISMQGTAPAAKLMMQSMSEYSSARKNWILKAPSDLSTTLFSIPYDLGIRIHNNSWGDTWDDKKGQLGYEADATTIDTFVHQHQDFVILIAAGNDADTKNAGKGQIGDNSAAKNCVTVGATGTTRPNDMQRYSPNVPALSGQKEL